MRASEAAGFESFCIQEYPVVYRACFAFCSDRELAEDATQEAFSRAWARWKRLESESWAGAWVTTTAMNLCRRMGKRRDQTASTDAVAGSTVSGGPHGEGLHVTLAVSRLPIRQRQVVLLFYFAGYRVHEIARVLQLSEGTVGTHLFRARRKLRDDLATDVVITDSKEANDAL